ncbi:MAG: hypothetical protein IKD43_00145 [Clostridia bacterium]|nr:hypothetical protein [Clostridia bacterium]
MLERVRSNQGGLQDHELLEILLFNTIPRKNTNPLAHTLLASFGSLDAVMKASYEQLLEVQGIGETTAAYLSCIAELYRRLPEKNGPPKIFRAKEFCAYLVEHFRNEKDEVIEIYCLDAKDSIRFMKRFTDDKKSSASVRPEIVNAVIHAHKPKALVVAHNHPNAACKPSFEDDRFTAKLQMLCSMSNVKFYDHAIVGTDGCYSYYMAGKMEEFQRNYNIEKLTGGSGE